MHIKYHKKGENCMKNMFLNTISKAVNNKKGTGEIVVILLLMVLGMFFLTKYVFKIDFPGVATKENQSEVVNKDQEQTNNETDPNKESKE